MHEVVSVVSPSLAMAVPEAPPVASTLVVGPSPPPLLAVAVADADDPVVVGSGVAAVAVSSSSGSSVAGGGATAVGVAGMGVAGVGVAGVGVAGVGSEGSTGSIASPSLMLTSSHIPFVHVVVTHTPSSHSVVSVVPPLLADAEPPDPLPVVKTEVLGGSSPPDDADAEADEEDVKEPPEPLGESGNDNWSSLPGEEVVLSSHTSPKHTTPEEVPPVESAKERAEALEISNKAARDSMPLLHPNPVDRAMTPARSRNDETDAC